MQQNSDVVRRLACLYREITTAPEPSSRHELCSLLRQRLNLFASIAKTIGWRPNQGSMNTDVYDKLRLTSI